LQQVRSPRDRFEPWQRMTEISDRHVHLRVVAQVEITAPGIPVRIAETPRIQFHLVCDLTRLRPFDLVPASHVS
jgi:hypothetical protein